MPRRPQRPRRVVIDGKPLIDDHFSGVGHYTMHLLRALDDLVGSEIGDDLDVRIAVPAKRVGRLREHGYRHLRPLPVPLTLTRYRRLLVAGRLPSMDLLLGRGTYFFPDFVRWPLARSRSITAVHDLCFVKVPDMVDAGNGEFLRRAVADAVASSDRITALTHTMADEIASTYPIDRGRIAVVGCAADRTHFYRRSEREVQEVQRRHGIFGDYVLSVGNLEPRKNQARLVEAFCALPDDLGRSLTLVLAGAGAWHDGELRAQVEAGLAAGRKILLLLDQVGDDDLPALYSGASAFAYVSVYEGFGMPPLEAMACGTPVVASTASVLPEVVGDGAVGVDPLDPASIAAGLESVLRLDEAGREALVAKGRANVLRYRWDDAAATLLRTIDEVSAP